MELLSFEELGSDLSVRLIKIENINYLSVRDIIMIICKKSSHEAAEVWRRLNPDLQNGLQPYLKTHQFAGRGQSPTPVITLDGALQLIMILPGNVAKEYRSKACTILKRYLAGDMSLVEEIKANAISSTPINVLARESMEDQSDKKRLRKEALEDFELEERRAALEERKAAIKERNAATKKKEEENDKLHQEVVKMKITFLESLFPDNELDDRCKLMIRDQAMNSLFQPTSSSYSSLALTNSETMPNGEGNPKSVSDLVSKMDPKVKTSDLVAIGKIAAKLYSDRHKSKPKQHAQFIGGRSCNVNHYVEKDHDIVEEAYKQYFDRN